MAKTNPAEAPESAVVEGTIVRKAKLEKTASATIDSFFKKKFISN